MGWEILPHLPYSPDIAPSDYHLFRALQFHMSEKSFVDVCQLEADIRKFFEAQPGSFYKDGIHSLPYKWRIAVDNNGDCILDRLCLFRGL